MSGCDGIGSLQKLRPSGRKAWEFNSPHPHYGGDMKKYAFTFVWWLKRLIEDKAAIRIKRIAGVDYPDELEWVKLDEISLKCWRETCRLNKLEDGEEIVRKTIEGGGFVNRSPIEGRQKWLVERMIHHGLIDRSFKVTELGKEVYEKQWIRK
jgi:hypothetical protein